MNLLLKVKGTQLLDSKEIHRRFTWWGGVVLKQLNYPISTLLVGVVNLLIFTIQQIVAKINV